MREIFRQIAEGLLAAAVFYENTLKQKVSTPSPFYTIAQARKLIKSNKGINAYGWLRNIKADANGRIYYNPSQPGEYPKLRTGAGQKSITHEPKTVAEVMDTMYVRVGYVLGDHHLLTLEMEQHRKGLIDLLDEMRPQLSALALAAFKSS